MPVLAMIVCGGRGYSDKERLHSVLDEVSAVYSGAFVLEGGARGADRLAREWAAERGFRCRTIPADWDTHGLKAGAIRNSAMLAELLASSRTGDGREVHQAVVAFPGGAGTADMVRKARAAEVDVRDLRGGGDG